MKLAIVITTINPPTEAVRAWAEKGHTIVVGDDKTVGWESVTIDGVLYVPPGSHMCPPCPVNNHYVRKNLGYSEAICSGATVIFDTDDDNIPKENWAIPAFEGTFAVSSGRQKFVNAYRYFSSWNVWPRGFPLDQILEPFDSSLVLGKHSRVGVWQGLADDAPDVDAIFRLTRGGRVFFDSGKPIVLAKGSICPFNSQNTFIRQELFPLLYLPMVSFRFTDILRGLVAQPIMWLMDYHLGFTEATVEQHRNQHNLMSDFESEIPVYRHAARISDTVSSAISNKNDICANLWAAYSALVKEGIVEKEELTRLWMWLKIF